MSPDSHLKSLSATYPMRIILTVTAGPNKGRVFTFDGHDTFIVGRSKRAHFRLRGKDEYFSRVQFLVELNPPYCRLLDLDSTNGTNVNGKRVTSVDLKNGDQISAGTTVIQVAVVNDESAAEIAVFRSSGGEDSTVEQRPPADQGPATKERRFAPTLKAPMQDRCLSCDAIFGDEATIYPLERSGANLCAVCLELIRARTQPIKGYQLIEEKGRGGMGVIYKAVREADGTLVALKAVTPALSATRADLDRFLREASILCQLNHPHITEFRELGESDGQVYIAMEFVKGQDAGELLKEQGPMPIARAVELVCQLLEALEYAHARSFVHRDIKPSNLLVAPHDGDEIAKLADFGLARVYQSSKISGLTMTGDVLGTVPFMAPEQVTHFRDSQPPVDQYATGATLYALLTTKLVYDFPRQTYKQLALVLEKQPVPIQNRRPDIPARLAEVVHRALAREPAERFPDVSAMRESLIPFAS